MELTPEQEELAKALSVKQLAFANLIVLKDQNKLSDADCYIRAGYKVSSKASAESKASRLLVRNGKVWAYVETFKKEAAKKTGLSYEYLYQHVMDTLEADISDFFETVDHEVKVKGGNRRKVRTVFFKGKIEDLPKSVARAVQSVKQTKDGLQITLPPRNETYKVAIQLLAAKGERVDADIDLGSGNEVDKVSTIIEKIALGEIPLPVAECIMRGLQIRANLVDQIEVQERLKRIEEKLNA